jgi:hypothetical protein
MEWLLGIFLTISFHPYPGDILKPNELWFSISHEQKMSKSLSLSVSTTMTHLTDTSYNTVSAPCNILHPKIYHLSIACQFYFTWMKTYSSMMFLLPNLILRGILFNTFGQCNELRTKLV